MNVPSKFLSLWIRREVEANDRFELDPRWSDTGDRYVLLSSRSNSIYVNVNHLIVVVPDKLIV